MIPTTQYDQLRDYITQIKTFSKTDGFPKITQGLIARILSVSDACLSSFMTRRTEKSHKIMRTFVRNYPEEVASWPKGSKKLNRVLSHADVRLFLNLPEPQSPTPPEQAAENQSPSEPAEPHFIPRPQPLSRAPIVVGYRGHQSAKDGQGMVYDHFTIQKATKHPTMVSYTRNSEAAAKAKSNFQAALRQLTSQLQVSGRNLPPHISNAAEAGLLFIPGRVRQVENEPIRNAHERKIIKNALNRGQPILSVCAGAWRAWEVAYSLTRRSNRPTAPSNVQLLNPVTDHVNSRMLGLNKHGTKTVHNTQIHNIKVLRNTFLADGMTQNSCELPRRVPVNSVHWKAVNENRKPSNFRVSARAVPKRNLNRKNRQGNLMNPQANTVEAFESVLGAPVLGIQWHPEGYNLTDKEELKSHLHINLLRYMARAGDAYAAKRRMLREMEARVEEHA